MNPVTQAYAFIEADLDREQCCEWLDELLEIQDALRTMYAPTGMLGMHARPDLELNHLIMGINALITRAELIGVVDVEDGDGWIVYAPLEA